MEKSDRTDLSDRTDRTDLSDRIDFSDRTDRSLCKEKVNVYKKNKTRYVAYCHHHRYDGVIESKFTPTTLMERHYIPNIDHDQTFKKKLPKHVDWDEFKKLLKNLFDSGEEERCEMLESPPFTFGKAYPDTIKKLSSTIDMIGSLDNVMIHCISMIPLDKHDKIVSPAWNALYILHPVGVVLDRNSPLYFFYSATAGGKPSKIYPGYEMGLAVRGSCGVMFSPLSDMDNIYNWIVSCDSDTGCVNGLHIHVQTPVEFDNILNINIELELITKPTYMSFVSLGIFNHIVPNDIFEKIQKGGYMFEIAKTKMDYKNWNDGEIYDFIEMDNDEVSASLSDHILGAVLDDIITPSLEWELKPYKLNF
jgi:hypothetical protein